MASPLLRRCLRSALAPAVLLLLAADATAICDVIPGATILFRGALGSADRPFALPGDFVQLTVEPELCDRASQGFPDLPNGLPAEADYVVTLLFTPIGGPARAVVLATDCAALASRLGVCAGQLGGGAASCVQVNGAGQPGGLRVVDPKHLSFRFPDTDDFLAPPGDGLGLAGPAKIVVTNRAQALPCGVATQRCADASTGLTACLDELYVIDGTCRSGTAQLGATFSSFTALPRPNDYLAMVEEPGTTSVRFTTDAAGNVLAPMDWRGVLVRVEGTPYPRQVRGSTSIDAFPLLGGPIEIPDASFLSAYSPQGLRVPPIFTPITDPSTSDATLFGTVDAPIGVTRIARKGTGTLTCSGGPNAGQACTTDGECTPGDCALFEFRDRAFASAGPVVIPPGGYAVEAQTPSTLEGQSETGELFAFVVPEGLAGTDQNGDGDLTDPVVVLRNGATGAIQPIGDGGAQSRPTARVSKPPFRFSALAAEDDVVAFLEPEPLQGDCTVPAVCDQNGDGEVFDTLLRVFRVGQPEPVYFAPQLAVDAAPVVNGESLALSDGLLFFRRPEWGGAPVATQRTSVDATGSQPVYGLGPAQAFQDPVIDASGAHTCFPGPRYLLGGADTIPDVYCRDLQGGAAAIARVNPSASGGDATGGTAKVAVSSTGRFVVYESTAQDLVSPASPIGDSVFIRDRDADEDGIFDEPGIFESTTTRIPGTELLQLNISERAPAISDDGRHVAAVLGGAVRHPYVYDRDTDANGVFDELAGTALVQLDLSPEGDPPDERAFGISISGNGRHVLFSSLASNLLDTPDTNGARDVFVRDRDTDGDGVFDEPGAARTVRMSVASDGSQSAGGGSLGTNTQGIRNLSADGRFAAFVNATADLVPGDTNGTDDAFVHDRDADEDGVFDEPGQTATIRVSVSSAGAETAFSSVFLDFPSLSPDGRYVTFAAGRTTALVPWDMGPASLVRDGYLHDRLLGLTQPITTPGLGLVSSYAIAPGSLGSTMLARDARQAVFRSKAGNLVDDDTNDEHDTFARGVPLFDGAYDLTGEGALDDTVLEVLDVRVPAPAPVALGAATRAAVAAGNAAFLRPEPGVVRAGVDLNADGDAADSVVQLYRNRAGVVNLSLAARELALSPTFIAAITDGAPRVAVNDAATGTAATWNTLARAAAGLQVRDVTLTSGFAGVAGSLVPETLAGDTNLDGDPSDRVLALDGLLRDPPGAPSATPISVLGADGVPQAAEDFVLGDEVVAFRTRESSQGPDGTDLNDDDDTADDVLQAFDLSTGTVVGSGRTVVPCPFEACDPRTPYRVIGTTVRFIEFENGIDLNNNGLTNELLVQVFNVRSGETTTVGVVAPDPPTGGVGGAPAGADPLADPVTPDGGTTTVFVTNGRCLESTPTSCSTSASCGTGEFCDVTESLCKRDHGTCRSDADCPAGSDAACAPEPVTAVASDTDGDAILDPFDNCPENANANQADLDSDGVGDACDVQTCGNAAAEVSEECDDGNLAAGDGCSAACKSELDDCTDGFDDDGDGLVDAADPGCAAYPFVATESPNCSDGIDNDGDGKADATDPSCPRPWVDTEELNPSCGLLGIEPLLLYLTLARLRRRRRSATV